MIDAMFQEGTDQALNDQLQRPAPFKADPARVSLGGLAAAPFRGFGAAPLTSGAFVAEVAGAFGQAMAAGASPESTLYTPSDPEKLKQDEQRRRQMLEQGPDFSNPAGDAMRDAARRMMPDPQTSHASEQIIAGLAEFGTKAVGYSLATGPFAPLLLGADVGMAEADKLKQQGVDVATRTKAGAVAGAVAGVSIALPVAVPGSVAKTAAAVAVGGPGGFVAQNAAERAILNNAGYKDIASTYDPLDPVGLALSTLVPAGFGAVAVRGARAKPAAPAMTLHDVILSNESNGQRYAKDGSVLTSPKGAKGEMQVLDSTNLDPGFGVRPAADNSLAERARVGRDYIDAMVKRYGREDQAMAAYNAGPGAMDAALARAKKEGGDWLSYLPKETQDYVTKGMRKLGSERTNVAARDAVSADPDTVAAARVRQTLNAIESYKLTPASDLAGATAHADAMEVAHAQLARGEAVNVTDLVNVEPVRTGVLLDDMIATGEAARGALAADAGRFDAPTLQRLTTEVEQLRAQRPDVERLAAERAAAESIPVEQARAAVQADMAGRIAENEAAVQRLQGLIGEQQGYQRAGERLARVDADLGELRAARGDQPAAPNTPRTVALRAAEVFRPEPAPAARAARAQGEPRATTTGTSGNTSSGATDSGAKPAARPGGEPSAEPGAAALDAGTAAALEANPDLMVQLEGMDKPVRAAELLDQVRKEAADDAKDATLVDVAANCFLRT